MAAMRIPEPRLDLCLMNYPSRRGIRLNPRQSRWTRQDGWGKLIQTTWLPRLTHTAFLTLLLPDHLRLTVIGERRRCVGSYFTVVSRRSKCWEVRELISKVPLFRQTSPVFRRHVSDKCASCKLKLKIGSYAPSSRPFFSPFPPPLFFSRNRLNKAR